MFKLCMARNLAQMNSPDDDSFSELLRGHEYAKRMKVCVKKFGFSKRENLEGIWKFWDLNSVMPSNEIRVLLLYGVLMMLKQWLSQS